MDSPDLSLIGAHGYCSQELVNLLLTGRQDIQGDPDGFPLNLELVPNHQGLVTLYSDNPQAVFICFALVSK